MINNTKNYVTFELLQFGIESKKKPTVIAIKRNLRTILRGKEQKLIREYRK